MARQSSIIPFSGGSVGTITFYKAKDGTYKVRQKRQPKPGQFETDPNLALTRQNCSEFGRAGKAGKMLRYALRTQLEFVNDTTVVGRLTKEMMKVIKADMTSPRGFRNVIDGEAELLTGFEFNSSSSLATILFPQYTTTIDRATGNLTVSLPAFIPATSIMAPFGTTHFRVFSIATSVDFEKERFAVASSATPELPWNTAEVAAINHVNNVGANSTHPLFLVLGLSFFQLVGGQMNPLRSNTFNPAAIVAVSGV